MKDRQHRHMVDLATQAAPVLMAGNRLVIPSDLFDDEAALRIVLADLAQRIGVNVRASVRNGTVVFYQDGGESDGLEVMIGVRK